MSFSSRQNAARLYWKRLLSRLPNRRMPSCWSLNRKPRKSNWNGWMPTRIAVEIVAVRDVAEVIVDERLPARRGSGRGGRCPSTARRTGRAARARRHNWRCSASVSRYSMSGGLKAVEPLISATPTMKVCDDDQAVVLAEDVDAAGLLGGLHADRDREGARLEHRVRDRRWRRRTSRPRRAPGTWASGSFLRPGSCSCCGMQSGRSPLSVFWLYGSNQRSLTQAERLDQPPAVGDRDLVGREGLGRRRAHRAGIVLARPRRADRAAARRGGGGRRSASASSAGGCAWLRLPSSHRLRLSGGSRRLRIDAVQRGRRACERGRAAIGMARSFALADILVGRCRGTARTGS